MSEETKNTQPEKQPEKTGLDDTRKSALLRYVAVLFAVAFILVLLSMFSQMRDSKSAISELSQSSTSALQKAEQLQDENQELRQTNVELVQDKKFLQQQVEQITTNIENLETDLEALQEDAEAAAEEQQKLLEAYEALLLAMETGNTENLEQYKEILGENGLKAYETLTKEVE